MNFVVIKEKDDDVESEEVVPVWLEDEVSSDNELATVLVVDPVVIVSAEVDVAVVSDVPEVVMVEEGTVME